MENSNLRSYALAKVLSNSNLNASQAKVNKTNVQNLVEMFQKLNHSEKLLFLVDISRGGANSSLEGANSPPLEENNRLYETQSWLETNFTPDNQTALPKEEVYDLYVSTATTKNTKPISTADFGKLMRQVFPQVRARRLGQRGASKYCYANIRRKSEFDVEKPTLGEIGGVARNFEKEFLSWGKSSFGVEFGNVELLLNYMKSNQNILKGLKRRRNSSVNKNNHLGKPNKEDNEIKNFFSSSQEDHLGNEWPQLRNLLSNEFAPIKKRHCSNNVGMNIGGFLDDEGLGGSSKELLFMGGSRSASVPIFDRADSGYDSVHSNTPISSALFPDNGGDFNNGGGGEFNPLLSSVASGNGGDNNLFDSVFDLISQDEDNSGGAEGGGDHLFGY